MDISIQIIDEVLMIFRQQPNTSNITGPPVVWIFQAGNWGAILYLSYNGIDFRSSAIMVFNIGERLEALRAEGKPFPDALRPHQVEVLSILLPNKTIFSLKSLGGCYRAHFGRSSCCIEHCNGRWKVSAADGRQCFWPGYIWTHFVIFDQYKTFEISEEGKTAILILPLVALEPQVEDEMTRLGLRFVSLTRSPVESLFGGDQDHKATYPAQQRWVIDISGHSTQNQQAPNQLYCCWWGTGIRTIANGVKFVCIKW